MSSPQDRFAKIAQQGQEAVSGAVRTWSDSIQRLSGQPGGSTPDVSAVVDSAFDLAERLLETQREFTKTVLQAVATGTGNVTDAAAQTINRAAGQAAQAAAGTADTATDAAGSAADAAQQGADAADEAAAAAEDARG